MTVRFLLDTNVLCEPLRQAPDPIILERFDRHRAEICTASVAWHELLFGMERLPTSRRRKTIEDYIATLVAGSLPLPILPYDAPAAAWHAEERARLESRGRPAPFRDGQIGAIARTRDLTLVTANPRDFRRLSGLIVVDWSEA
mgnify:CR=1 FL=1